MIARAVDGRVDWQESSRPPTALEVWPQTYGRSKTPTPSKGLATRGAQKRANRTTPRTRQEVPDASVALPAPPQRQTPKVALTTQSRGRRGAADSSREPWRPVPRRPRHVPAAAKPKPRKSRAGKRRDHRLTAHTEFLTPTYAPSASCADDATWSYGTKASNTCAYVARKLKRCKAKNTDGVRTALEACPITCGTC